MEQHEIMNMTADEIVSDMLKNMDDETRKILYESEPDRWGSYVGEYHFTLGLFIRNKYKLWGRKDIVIPDVFSGEIIDKLINRIKEEGLKNE